MRVSEWSQKGYWAVVWQKDKSPWAIELLEAHRLARVGKVLGLPEGRDHVFGLSDTAEEAMGKVQQALRNDPFFRKRYRGGVFRPVPYHICVALPDADSFAAVNPSLKDGIVLGGGL